MLYQIEGTNTRVFGSLHRVPPGATEWIPRVIALCAWAEEFAVEMVAAHHVTLFTEPTDRSTALLPVDLYKKVRAMWPAHFGPFENASLPGAAIFASVAALMSDAGVEELVERLAGDSRKVYELEDAAGFLRGFADIPASQFATAVRMALRRTDDYRRITLQQIYDCWQKGDGKGLHAVLMDDLPPSFVDAVFRARNEAWAHKISAMVKRPQRLLVFCGAGHLYGANSLLDCLARDHGLVTTAISY